MYFQVENEFFLSCTFTARGANNQPRKCVVFVVCYSAVREKVSLLLKGLKLPLDDASITIIKRFVASAIGKVHKLRTAKLCDNKTE